MDQRMNEAVKVDIQLQSDRLRDEAQADNDEFLKTIDENMQKIIKEQVKEQVKVQVSKILPRIEQTVNEQLEAKVMTRSSNSLKTSYALVEAYEFDKIILDTCGEIVTLKRRHDDDADKDEEPSTGPDWGSKRRREGKKLESASAPQETATRSAGRSTQGSQSRQMSASESAAAEEPMQTTFEMEEPSHPKFETGVDDQPIIESSQHPEWFSQQQKQPTLDRDWNKTLPATHRRIQLWISKLAKLSDSLDTLTPELLAGPTYELLKGSCKSLVELKYYLEEVYKATTDQLDWVNPEGQQYPHNMIKSLPLIPNNRGRHVIPFDHFINNDLAYLRGGYDKHALWGVSHWRRKRQQFYGFTVNQESTRDVYSKRRIIAVTELMIVECIIIQRRVKDLQLCVERYQKKLNLTKPDTYHSDLKRKEAYIPYSNPRGFIYQNKDKRNRLMRIGELHKFSDMTLTDVRTQSIWRKSDKDRAAAMIQAIGKRLKTRRIMRSLERFVGGRLYEGDFRMLQRTI
nr:hypothetical protein [Tanacetum cinerariifolium]